MGGELLSRDAHWLQLSVNEFYDLFTVFLFHRWIICDRKSTQYVGNC